MHTADSIRDLLYRNPKAVYRALVVLYQRQTEDEKASETTKHDNNRGFNYRDAKKGSNFALLVMRADPLYNCPLSVNELAAARHMLHKYAGQLARIANGQETPV